MLPIHIEGSVRIEGPGGRMNLTAHGDSVEVRIPRLRDAWRLYKLSRSLPSEWVTQGLRTAGVTVLLTVGRFRLARLDAHAKPGILSKRLTRFPVQWLPARTERP